MSVVLCSPSEGNLATEPLVGKELFFNKCHLKAKNHQQNTFYDFLGNLQAIPKWKINVEDSNQLPTSS